MKKYLFYLLLLVPSATFGAVGSLTSGGTLLRSCPNGYITIDRPDVSVATSCSRSTAIGDATSCNSDAPGYSCFMYAPVGVSYVDSAGTFEFIAPCPLTE